MVALLSAGCASWPGRSTRPPRLVVVVVVDQLRPDRISAARPDGLGRLVREGRVFDAARLDHAFSETCPGHATASTGRHPRAHGIPGNRFHRDGALERTYCVEDPTALGTRLVAGASEVAGAEDASGRPAGAAPSEEAGSNRIPPPDDPADGRSPGLLRTGGLADWLAAARPSGRVVTVAGKDRSAILLGGRGADAAWWLDWDRGGALATSRYYRPDGTLPAWAAGWDADRVRAGLPAAWTHPAQDPTGRIRDDDHPAEDPRASRTSPHPLPAPGASDVPAEHLLASPFADRIVLELALALIEAEGLGTDSGGGSDVLGVGLSATDVVGHLYGPWSQEARAALADLDEALGAFLATLEARLGRGRVGVVLTSDHGVLPLPEWVQSVHLPEDDCPVPGGRVPDRALVERAAAAVEADFGAVGREHGPWVVGTGTRLVLNHARIAAASAASGTAAADGPSPARAVAAVQQALRGTPGIAHVWSRAEVEGASDDAPGGPDLKALLRRSLAPGRSPDVVLVPERGCLVTDGAFGTSHGSPHDYDRRIPLVFWGPGVEPGRDDRPARLVDLAPTVAAWLGIAAPDDLDGRVLPLR